MNTHHTVRYFDGKTSKARTAQLMPHDKTDEAGAFMLAGAGFQVVYRAGEYEFLPSVGNSPAVLSLADGGRIELIDGVPSWLPLRHRGLFDKVSIMESSLGWVFVSLAVACLMMFVTLRFGIPYASHHIAQNLPADTLMQVGNKAEEYVMEITKPSTLPQARQNEIIALYNKLNGNPKA